MHLDLTEEQLAVLDEVVSEKITSLGGEIRHTDNRDYKHGLAQKRDLLREMSARLRDLSAPSATNV
jgi:hypothetical protein